MGFWGVFFPLCIEESFMCGAKGPKTDKSMEKENNEKKPEYVAGDKLFICLLTEALTH